MSEGACPGFSGHLIPSGGLRSNQEEMLEHFPSGPGTHQAPPGGADKNIFLEGKKKKSSPADNKITDGWRV